MVWPDRWSLGSGADSRRFVSSPASRALLQGTHVTITDHARGDRLDSMAIGAESWTWTGV